MGSEVSLGWSVNVRFDQSSSSCTQGWQTGVTASTFGQWIVFLLLRTELQPVSNLLCIAAELCFSCSFGSFQKWSFWATGKVNKQWRSSKMLFNTTILCSVLGNIRRSLHLCKHTDLLALCLGSRSTWFQKLAQKPFRSGEIKTLFVHCCDWLAAGE